jgi:hypothetical protein
LHFLHFFAYLDFSKSCIFCIFLHFMQLGFGRRANAVWPAGCIRGSQKKTDAAVHTAACFFPLAQVWPTLMPEVQHRWAHYTRLNAMTATPTGPWGALPPAARAPCMLPVGCWDVAACWHGASPAFELVEWAGRQNGTLTGGVAHQHRASRAKGTPGGGGGLHCGLL